MIRKSQWNILLFLVAVNTVAFGYASLPEGAGFEKVYRSGSLQMNLTGYGIKRFLTVRFVAAALYLPEGTRPDGALGDIPKRLEVVYLQSIPKRELDRATVRGIRKNVGEEEYSDLEAKIEELNAYWPSVRKYDRIALTYLPEEGMEITVNGEYQGVVRGREIAAALFSVWIGERPADKVIKEKLLGIYEEGTGDE